MRLLFDRLAPARLFLMVVAGLGVVLVQELASLGLGSGQAVGNYSLRWVVLMAVVLVISLMALLGAVISVRSNRLEERTAPVSHFLQPLGKLNWLGVAAIWIAYIVLVFNRFEYHFNHPVGYTWFFLIMAGLGAFFAAAAQPEHSYLKSFLFVAVAYGVGVKALGFLPDITSFPFSLAWSEASRFYYSSLPYSNSLFGIDIPLSPLHPSRYLILGLAYWIPDAPVWVHRLWQVILWLALSGLGGAVLARRVTGKDRTIFWVFVGWSMLFLLQGPVYYHLMVSVILVMWGFDLARPKKTLVVVILSSIWAGISRINWVPVPAMLAIALYLLERPVCTRRKWLDYLLPCVIWGVVGMVVALVSQAAYIPLSGNVDVSKFGSSFTADLLWYRLLPSPTYALGVFPAGMIVSLPLLVLIVVNWVRGRKDWHLVRIAGLFLMMLLLLTGGLIVSTKIGGGSNIHNLDAFMVLIWLVGSYIGFGRFASETGLLTPVVWRPWAMISVVVSVAILWNLNIGSPFRPWDFSQAQVDMQKLDDVVQKHQGDGNEILFITQRQLIVFDMIHGVKMVPDYELLTLMEMAISNNQPYLQAFTKDLKNHRFALIVADRQNEEIRDPKVDGFAEENNAWVENIAAPLIKYYQSELFLETQGIDLLVPKENNP